MTLQVAVDQAVQKVCPIDGISFGKLDDKKTWRIDFKREATDDQKKLAHEVVEKFVWDEKEQENAERKAQCEKYKDDLLYRKFFKEYKDRIPSATFEDFIAYLKTIEV